MRYAEFQVTTHFSFLRGASSAEELFPTAAVLGIDALGIVDRNTLAGIVRAWEAAKTTGVRLVVGCRLDLSDGMSILVYPTDRPAYSRLCRLLSLGKSRGGKGNCVLDFSDVAQYADGLIAVLVPDEADETCGMQLRKLAELFDDRAYVSLCPGVGRTTGCASMVFRPWRPASKFGQLSPTTCCFTSLPAASYRTS
ncbi:hypothetical protein AJ87_35360 [Rhizobium yanglingense]|nr:hypothetical protein AJ87_35360 [Rhizobium yanglingense]